VKIYTPLLYSEQVKRPGKKYFLNNIIGEDFIILLLSFTYSSSNLWQNVISLFLLQMAFWCVYELGYIENDIVGEKFEDKAILSDSYQFYQISYSFWQPWLWSLSLSILGIVILFKDRLASGVTLNFLSLLSNESSNNLFWISQKIVYWIIFLLVIRTLFYIYNHINKQSRLWLYLLLQTGRYCGFLVILSTNTIGLMFLVSNVLTRSIQYILYRYLGGKESSWPMDFPKYFFCLLIYLLLIGVLAVNTRDISLLFNPQVLLIAIFCLLRGSKQFYNVYSQFQPVSKDGSNQTF
jgi:hypothetical protein